MLDDTKEVNYYVKGMHCASCEIIVEKKILESENIKSVKASTAQGKVLIKYKSEKPGPEQLNEMFKGNGYTFSAQPILKQADFKFKELVTTIGIGALIIALFIGLNKLGLVGLVNVNSKSSLPMFFVFGLIAGVSSCAALVGGIVLSMSKQWGELYTETDSTWKKSQPNLMFNAGRLISYGVFGVALGAIGSQLNLSLKFGSVLTLIVSFIMILLAFQMLGFKAFDKFQFRLPKFITRPIANESNFKGRYMPFIMGALTFFLPCGFTLTAQGLALLSGSPLQGGLIMFLFALGTLPTLLIIGFSSIKFSQNPQWSKKFLKIAGILVLFFALFNINAQLNVLGISSLSDLKIKTNTPTTIQTNVPLVEDGLPPVVDGKQILKMDASSNGYTPNYLKVRVGIPVQWEITDKGTSGCTNAIISQSLFDGSIPLINGQTSIKEFTPTNIGKYKFSCWMGMISGVIEVVN
jgi:sulfite exporter TauE/SafE/copper chaperone CopZ/plastocyanin